MKHQETALTLHKVVPMYIAPLLLMGSNEHCNAEAQQTFSAALHQFWRGVKNAWVLSWWKDCMKMQWCYISYTSTYVLIKMCYIFSGPGRSNITLLVRSIRMDTPPSLRLRISSSTTVSWGGKEFENILSAISVIAGRSCRKQTRKINVFELVDIGCWWIGDDSSKDGVLYTVLG